MTRLRLRAVNPYERQIVATILKGLAVSPAVAWCARMNTGAAVGQRFVRFGFVGLADIIGQLTDGRLLAIECKRPGEALTEEQAMFLHWVASAHGVAGIARSWEDVEGILAGRPLPPDPRLSQSGPRPAMKCLSNPKAAELNRRAIVLKSRG